MLRSPFPGMDPYLEHPALWPGVHQSLITYFRDALVPDLGERYFAQMGERVYITDADRGIYPDVAVLESGGGEPAPAGPVAETEADAAVVLTLEPEDVREPYLEIIDLRSGQRVVTVIVGHTRLHRSQPCRQSRPHKVLLSLRHCS